MKLKKKLDELSTDLELITYEETYLEEDMKSSSSSDPDDKNVIDETRTLISFSEFYELVKAYHKLDWKPKMKGIESYDTKVRISNDRQKERPFIMFPLFTKKETILLVGKEKLWKSMAALDFSLMLAGYGRIGGRFSAKKHCKVMYVDAEMPEGEFDQRHDEIIAGNYKNNNKISEYFDRVCILELEGEDKPDYSNEKDRLAFEDKLKGFDLLVMDNLGTLFSLENEQDVRKWREIFDWFRRLNKKGIAVLLVHHVTKSGTPRGTGKILHDVNVIMSISEPSKEEKKSSSLEMMVKFEIRGRSLKTEEKKGFFLAYNDDVKGQINRTILSPEGRPIEKETNSFVKYEEIQEYKLDKLDIDILNKARNPDVPFVTAGDFKDENADGRNSTAVGDHLKRLVDLGLLETNKKKTKGKKYWMAGREAPAED